MNRGDIEAGLRELQDFLCSHLAEIDGASFRSDAWDRPGGGGGITRILGGERLEKAAVNFSAVWGDTPADLAERLGAQSARFYATGLSMIVHPANPHAPTLHANLRYFETDAGQAWFGGGCDLTPYYLYEDDIRHFHRGLSDLCARHPVADYRTWKKACDRYFYLPHRGEARGVGGIFFDHVDTDLPDVWAFCLALGSGLIDLYRPIIERRLATPYDASQVAWHELRRGRYVEFNLVWDRGTRFGLDTGGRTESILASLPPRACWQYGFEPEPTTPEAALLDLVRGPPQEWA